MRVTFKKLQQITNQVNEQEKIDLRVERIYNKTRRKYYYTLVIDNVQIVNYMQAKEIFIYLIGLRDLKTIKNI